MADYEITIFAETRTLPSSINKHTWYQHMSMNYNGRNETFMDDTCQNGYKIQCAPAPLNSPATAETSIYVAIVLLAFVLISALVMFLVKNIRDKGKTIKDLQRQLSQKSEKYGTLENGP